MMVIESLSYGQVLPYVGSNSTRHASALVACAPGGSFFARMLSGGIR